MNPAEDTLPPTTQRIRAYFAPVNRATSQPTLFDPAQLGAFNPEEPPAPWLDLGFITSFKRHTATKVDALRSGTPAATQLQARSELEATLTFTFDAWGKLQLALAAGTQQMNLLKTGRFPTINGSGGTAIPAVALQRGSTAATLQLSTTDAANFIPGQLLAIDDDYTGTLGYLGAGVSGAYAKTALTDIDYTRRITLNVARIAGIRGGTVTLATPLLAGDPTSTMKVSAVTGFCDREGSTFFQEWSALFLAEGQQGERILWHYPRLQTTQGIAESTTEANPFETLRHAASFRALPVQDPTDNETVLCFRSYLTT